jgi:hypothetical protein
MSNPNSQQVQSPVQHQSQARLSSDVIESLAKEFEAGQIPATETKVEEPAPVPEQAVAQAVAQPEAVPEPVQAEPVVTKPAPLEKSFEKLAQEKAAFRAEQERIKPYMEALQQFDPLTLRALTQAVNSGDSSKVLQALNMQSTAQNVPESDVSRPEIPELAEIKEELSELRKFRAEQAENKLVSEIREATKDHKLISARGAHKMVLQYILDFKNRTGSPPGDTLSESYALAADAVEGYLKQEAESWRKVLTPEAPMVESPQVSQSQAAAPQPTSKTLSSAATSAPPLTVTTSKPKTAEEYQALALEDAKKLFGW